MAVIRVRVWSHRNAQGEAYADAVVDDVAEEITAVALFNATGIPFELTYTWKNKPQPDTFNLDPYTVDGSFAPTEVQFSIPPGQRKWVYVTGGDEPLLDSEVASLNVRHL